MVTKSAERKINNLAAKEKRRDLPSCYFFTLRRAFAALFIFAPGTTLLARQARTSFLMVNSLLQGQRVIFGGA